MNASSIDLAGALDAFYGGDAERLEALLRADPRLIRARVESSEGHYCGYFHRATLLHHVAGNPTIRPLPPNTLELTRRLLAHGAEVDAATEQGPAQPNDLGWSTLGLISSSSDARAAGFQRPLLELLLDHGADIDFRNGGPLVGAIYYGELEAGRFLVERGAHCDLVSAAGLGQVDRMERFVRADGSLSPEAHALVHYSQIRQRPSTAAEILGLALVVASANGQRDAASWLLAHGADVRARPPYDHRATPLHWAALRGQDEVAMLLLSHGADRTARDATFDGTPQGWAEHGGHAALAERLAS